MSPLVAQTEDLFPREVSTTVHRTELEEPVCITTPARPVSIDGSSSSSTVAVAASSSLAGFVGSITDSTERVVFVPHSELSISLLWIVSCRVVCLLPFHRFGPVWSGPVRSGSSAGTHLITTSSYVRAIYTIQSWLWWWWLPKVFPTSPTYTHIRRLSYISSSSTTIFFSFLFLVFPSSYF